jgi:hypothetical protein
MLILTTTLAIAAFAGWQAQPHGAGAGSECAQSFAAHGGLAGTWTGSWENHTFQSSGNLNATVAVNADCTATVMISGVFDQPGTQTISAHYEDVGESTVITITNHPLFGTGAITINEHGGITIQGTGAHQNITSYSGTGTLMPGHVEIDLTFEFLFGDPATETVELMQVSTPAPSPSPSPTIDCSAPTVPQGAIAPANTCTPPPTTPTAPPQGQLVAWGDWNCSGGADPVDSLLNLRHDAGLSTNTGDCPAMGTPVNLLIASALTWGDADCNATRDPVDSLKLLRHDAGLSVSQDEDCPALGSDVMVAADS